jgi:hypothetical protein
VSAPDCLVVAADVANHIDVWTSSSSPRAEAMLGITARPASRSDIAAILTLA